MIGQPVIFAVTAELPILYAIAVTAAIRTLFVPIVEDVAEAPLGV